MNKSAKQQFTFTCTEHDYISYTIADMAPGLATYGQGTGDILLDDLGCTGSETSLFDCSHSGVGTHNCAHSEDAGAVCTSECYCCNV